MNKLFIIIFKIFLFACICYGQTQEELKGLFTPQTAGALIREGELSHIFHEDIDLKYLPKVGMERWIINAIKKVQPTIGVEVLLIYKYKGKKGDSEQGLLSIYNTLRSLSTLKGIEYYSASRKRMRIMFHDAYIVDSPDKKNKLSDPIVQSIPSLSSLYVYQNDSSFGENVYKVLYHFKDNYFLMEMHNLTQIWWGIIPIIDPQKLKYIILIYPFEDYLVFYSVICVNAFNFLGIADQKSASFYNRIKALYKWFCVEYSS